MIRTIWLGLSFLIILAGVVSFRIAFGYFDVANAAGIPRLEGKVTAEIKPIKETPVKTAQLPIAYVSSATEVQLAATNETHAEVFRQTPVAIATSRIIGRERQERAALTIQRAGNQKAKRKLVKNDANTDKSGLAAEPQCLSGKKLNLMNHL